MTENGNMLSGRRIGIFGRGGSGKSTAAVLFACVLRDRGYEVCVLDADSTNAGLPQALGIDESPTPLLDYFGGMVFSGGAVTCPVDDPTPLVGAEVALDALPGEYCRKNREGIRLLVAGKIGDQGVGAGCDGPIGKIARDLRVRGNADSPVTLVDFKAGFEDCARGIITGLDWAVVIVDPTVASIQMAANMKDMVGQLRAGELPATRHLGSLELVQIANRIYQEASIRGVLYVLNKIRDEEIERYLRRQLAAHGIEPIGVLRDDPEIFNAWLRGNPVDPGKAKKAAEEIIGRLEEAEAAYSGSSSSVA